MKKIILAAALSISAVAFAAEQKEGKATLEYTIKSAKYAQGHVKNAEYGTLTLDYANQSVKLFVSEKSSCKVGRPCPAVVRALSVELPISSVETDACGIRHVTAMKDDRVVDGIMQKIKVSDSSDMTCRTFAAVVPKATYETAYYNRMNAKLIEEKSTMELSLKNVIDASAAILLKYQIHVGFSPDPTTMTLTVDAKGEVLAIERRMRTKKVSRTEIAQLSQSVLEKLKQQIATVPENTKLIDDQEGKPICSDSPVAQIFAYSNGQEIQIYESSGCHTSKSYDGEANSLTNAVLGLTYLAR